MEPARVFSVALFLLLNACVAWTSVRTVAALWPDFTGTQRAGAVAAVFCAMVIVIEAALGFAGALTPVATAAAVAIITTGGSFLLKRSGEIAAPPDKRFPLPIAALVFAPLLMVAVWAAATPPPAGGDGFIYHLNFPAVWLKHHRIECVPLPFGAQAATYYPLNTELLLLWLMLPFHEDFLTNAAQVPFLILCGALAAALSMRVLRTSRAAAVAGALATASAPAFVQQAVVARVDLAFTAWFLATLLFLFEWNDRRGLRFLLPAGICFGLFVGTKSLGLLYGALIVAPFLWMLRREKPGAAAAHLVVFLFAATVCGGFWYVHNLVVTGNPVYPLDFAPAGVEVFRGAYGREAMRAFHTSDPREIVRIVDFFLRGGLGAALPALWAAAVAMFAVKREFSARRAFLLALPALILCLFWFANPHNNVTNGRFLFPAFFLLACPAAYVIDRLGRGGTAAIAVLVAAAVLSAVQKNDLFQIIREVSTTLAGANPGLLAAGRSAVALLFAAGAVTGIGLAVRRPTLRRALFAVGILTLVPALLSTWRYHEENKYKWYAGFPLGRAWGLFDTAVPGGTRVAACGAERAYGLFGTGLRNEVLNVNVDTRDGWQFHDYHLRIPANRGAKGASERPQFHRAAPDMTAWIENLRKARAEYLFCAALEPIALRHMEHSPDGFTIEAAWAAANPQLFAPMFIGPEVRVWRFLDTAAEVTP